MRLGVMRCRKQYDHEIVGCTKGWMPGTEAMDRKGGYMSKRKGMCRDYRKIKRTSLWFICTSVFTVS